MSVIVKGMKMPTECRKCPFNEFGTISGETWCGVNDVTLANNFETINFDGRPDWCPLVALPYKHGRLIDADALEPDADYYDGDYWAYSVAQVCNAPTIVEPEGGE